MKIKNKYTISASNLASDLALQLQKSRQLLDEYQNDKAMTDFARGCMSTTRQMIKWQVWTDRAFIPLIVREYLRVRVIFPNNKNSQNATDQA
jgi:hypothetical protein